MTERKQETKGSGLKRIAKIGENGQIDFSRECVKEQNITEIYGPFTIPANPTDLSENPEWIKILHSEKENR